MINDLIDSLIDLVYPPICISCKTFIPEKTHFMQTIRIANSANYFICKKCENKIKYNIPTFCPKCSRHLGKNPSISKCNNCRNQNIYFDFAWSACIYDDFSKHLLHMFKYSNKTVFRHLFADKIISFVEQYNLDIKQFDLIIPIPLSLSRLRTRGYNQAFLIAELLSKYFNISINNKSLTRKKDTNFQYSLSKKERFTNIQGAFRINYSNLIKNKNILLIDDLLTTGATASGAAKTLKQDHAKTVSVLTFATVPEIN